MNPRTGRPKSSNPKHTQLGVRFDTEDLKKLDSLVEYYGKTRAEVIRIGVEKLYADLKKGKK